jgi:hypothetical protein
MLPRRVGRTDFVRDSVPPAAPIFYKKLWLNEIGDPARFLFSTIGKEMKNQVEADDHETHE